MLQNYNTITLLGSQCNLAKSVANHGKKSYSLVPSDLGGIGSATYW